MSEIINSRPKMEIFQVLRAGGMIAVLCSHAISTFIWSGEVPRVIQGFFHEMLLSGELVLDMFFCGSGFVIVYTCASHFGSKGAGLAFMLRRFTRIIPIYWFYLALAGLVSFYIPYSVGSGFQHFEWGNLIKSFLFIPYNTSYIEIVREQPWPLLTLGWTLNFEMLFYASFALVLGFGMKRAMIVYGALIAFALVVHGYTHKSSPVLYFWTSPQLLKFYAGCLIGYAFNRGVFFKIPQGLMFAILGGAIFAQAGWYYRFGDAYMDRMWFHVPAAIFVGILVGGVTLTSLKDKGAPKFIVRLGDASYSIYLVHIFCLLFLASTPIGLFMVHDMWARALWILFAMGMSIVLGLMSFKYLEIPMIRVLRRLIFRPREGVTK